MKVLGPKGKKEHPGKSFTGLSPAHYRLILKPEGVPLLFDSPVPFPIQSAQGLERRLQALQNCHDLRALLAEECSLFQGPFHLPHSHQILKHRSHSGPTLSRLLNHCLGIYLSILIKDGKQCCKGTSESSPLTPFAQKKMYISQHIIPLFHKYKSFIDTHFP